MNILHLRRLQAVRDELLNILRPRSFTPAYSQRELTDLVRQNAYIKRNLLPDATYILIGECIRIFDCDFYRDPSTRKISLTKRAMDMERWLNRQARKPAPRLGTTAAAKVAAAMEAREEREGAGEALFV